MSLAFRTATKHNILEFLVHGDSHLIQMFIVGVVYGNVTFSGVLKCVCSYISGYNTYSLLVQTTAWYPNKTCSTIKLLPYQKKDNSYHSAIITTRLGS